MANRKKEVIIAVLLIVFFIVGQISIPSIASRFFGIMTKDEMTALVAKKDSIVVAYTEANDSLNKLLLKIQADKDSLLNAVGKMKPKEVKNVILDRIIVPIKPIPAKIDGTQINSSEQSQVDSMVCYTNEQNIAIAKKLVLCDSDSASKPILQEKNDLETKVVIDTFSVVLAGKNEEIKELKKSNLKDKIYMYSAIAVSTIVVLYAAFH